jgi:hypothetical protein
MTKRARTLARGKKAIDPPDLPVERISSLSVEFLIFDTQNPRFTPDKELVGARPVDVIQELIKSADLKELVESIASNGYIDIEPLVIMRSRSHGPYTVLEGNRRLAALMMLNDATLAAEVGFQLPGFTPAAALTFKKVSVYRVEDRARARLYRFQTHQRTLRLGFARKRSICCSVV